MSRVVFGTTRGWRLCSCANLFSNSQRKYSTISSRFPPQNPILSSSRLIPLPINGHSFVLFSIRLCHIKNNDENAFNSPDSSETMSITIRSCPRRRFGSSSSLTPSILPRPKSHVEPVKRIILIRNGWSEANEDVGIHVEKPDWRIQLVERGRNEAFQSGMELADFIGDDPVYFYYSPYRRSRETLKYILKGYDARRNGLAIFSDPKLAALDYMHKRSVDCRVEKNSLTLPNSSNWKELKEGPTSVSQASPSQQNTNPIKKKDNIIGMREDVRLRDGDFGRYQTREELYFHIRQRDEYGSFFYRFPFGESGADVCDRVTSFLDAFQRERVEFPMDTNVVIITHGLTIRMFVKRWFHLTVDTFHNTIPPPPGSLVTLTRRHHLSCFRMEETCVESMRLPLSLNEDNGYKYRNKELLGSMSTGARYM